MVVGPWMLAGTMSNANHLKLVQFKRNGQRNKFSDTRKAQKLKIANNPVLAKFVVR